MGFLSVLDLLGVLAGPGRQKLGTEALRHHRTGRGQGSFRQRCGVGSHVGDKALLVEALGRPHGLGGAEAELATRFLLQGRGDERRRRRAAIGSRFYVTHGEGPAIELSNQRLGASRVEGDAAGPGQQAIAVEVLTGGDPPIINGGQPGGEATPSIGTAGRGESAAQIPVAGRNEAHAFPFAFHHDAGGDGLDSTGGTGRGDLAPQDLGDLVAVDAVQDAAGLLSVDQPTVDLARVIDGVLNGGGGDLVEHHSFDRDLGRGVQDLEQMPSNGLPFAILIGGEIELVGVLEEPLQAADMAFLVGVNQVEGLEVVLDVDSQDLPFLVRSLDVAGADGQVTDVANGGLDDEVLTQEPRDRASFGGGFDDHEATGHRDERIGTRRRSVKRGEIAAVRAAFLAAVLATDQRGRSAALIPGLRTKEPRSTSPFAPPYPNGWCESLAGRRALA